MSDPAAELHVRQGRRYIRHRRCCHRRRDAEVRFSANSQGRVVAADLLADLNGGDPVVARYRNTCWSLLAAEDSIKIGADYTPGDKDGKPILVPHDPFISQKGEGQERRRKNYAESLAWYHAIISDAFNDQAALSHRG